VRVAVSVADLLFRPRVLFLVAALLAIGDNPRPVVSLRS